MNAFKQFNKSIELFCMTSLFLMLIMDCYYYMQLPLIVTTHFDPHGLPDGFETREIIFILPLLALVGYLMASFFQYYNIEFYPTSADTPKHLKLLNKVKIALVLIFNILNYMQIQVSKDNNNFIAPIGSIYTILPLILIVMMTIIVIKGRKYLK